MTATLEKFPEHYYLFVGGPLNFSWHAGTEYLDPKHKLRRFFSQYKRRTFVKTEILCTADFEETPALRAAIGQALSRGPDLNRF